MIISIHALREEGDHIQPGLAGDFCVISIHALREEGDGVPFKALAAEWNFYPRPPRGGRQLAVVPFPSGVIFLSTPSARRATLICSSSTGTRLAFLSTPSARRATFYFCVSERMVSYFYPRPPRGGRPGADQRPQRQHCISIHALREEGDFSDSQACFFLQIFLSTPSARRATQFPRAPAGRTGISIHALREEGDISRIIVLLAQNISIHALREEGDPRSKRRPERQRYFYPRPPRGGRQAGCRTPAP